jgi:predicted nucleic acid-binding protein
VSIVYAESSAVLSWLLGESGHQAVLEELSGADRIVTSVITSIECSRALARARATSRLKPAEELAGLRMLDEASATWNVMDISERVSARAKGGFPNEPVRTLDAVHLATAAVFAEALGSLRVLTLNDRVRQNALAMGMTVAPA